MTDPKEESRLIGLIALRERQCRIEQRAYGRWLGILTPLRWFTVAGGIILSALAGATVLGKPQLFGDQWPVYGGVLALVASILTGLHTVLHCDTHQAECRRLVQLYESLEAGFQGARARPESEMPRYVEELEAKFAEAKAKAAAAPPRSFRERAEREVEESRAEASGVG